MKLTYVATFNSRDLNSSNNCAGTGYYIPESLKKQSLSLQYIDSLKENLALKTFGKFKRHYHEIFSSGKYFKALDPLVLRDYANQVSKELSKIETDIVFSATITPTAYLECKQPIVFWADATFENMLNFYPQYTGLCEESIQHGHLMERLALQRCKLAIYSSEWAAQTAIDYYKTDSNKVKVVPFGANINVHKSFDEVKGLINSRPSNKCKLLFLGVDWFRKGGDVALKIAEELNNSGLNTELTIIGSQPIVDSNLPEFVNSLGFISKGTQEGQDKISKLLMESHFLILPTIADCTPIVFCEANSLGVPCLSNQVGGIPTIINNGVNGQLFPLHDNIPQYCDYITNIFSNYETYKDLAISSYYEYESRLNWTVVGKSVKDLLFSCI